MAIIPEKTATRFDAANPPKGLNLAQEIRTAVQGNGTSQAKMTGGQVTIANGATTATVTGLDAFDGAMVFLTPAQADTYASVHWYGAVASGTLTVTVDTDPGNAAGLKLNYMLLTQATLT